MKTTLTVTENKDYRKDRMLTVLVVVEGYGQSKWLVHAEDATPEFLEKLRQSESLEIPRMIHLLSKTMGDGVVQKEKPPWKVAA